MKQSKNIKYLGFVEKSVFERIMKYSDLFCKSKSKNVKLITLKSMLKPSALEALNAKENHYFCSTKDCDVVYFDSNNQVYLVSDIQVPFSI